MTQHIYVNGPTNVVRLGNKESNKVIYIFFDVHNDPNYQSKCEDIRSHDIARFLIQTFDDLKLNSDITYDFMFERSPINPNHYSRIKGMYIDQIAYLFNKTFKIDLDKNVVQKSDELPNVRLHWVDVRNYVLNFTIDMIYKNIPQAINNLQSNPNIFNANQFSDVIKIINAQIVFLYKTLYETKDLNNPKITKRMFSMEENILANYSLADYDEITKKVIYKLLKSYKNKNIQEKMLYIINNDLHDIFSEFFKYIEEILKKLEELKIKLEIVGNNNINDVLMPRRDGTFNYGMDPNEVDEYLTLFNNIKKNYLILLLVV